MGGKTRRQLFSPGDLLRFTKSAGDRQLRRWMLAESSGIVADDCLHGLCFSGNTIVNARERIRLLVKSAYASARYRAEYGTDWIGDDGRVGTYRHWDISDLFTFSR